MLYFIKNKGDCTGCSACVNTCPIGCIAMEKDSEGFLYPTATDACIGCGKCQKICPIENLSVEVKQSIEQKAYCGITKDIGVWRRSASGGAFSEICRAFGDKDTIFCGAVWDGLKVHHVCVKGWDAIAPLCKSKYVASDPQKVFSEIKSYLADGRKVVFCGTPCQVAGLKSYLKKKYENLLLIDLICHGVGSPEVFESCMDVIGNQFHSTVKEYEFRTKGKVYTTDHLQKVTTNETQEIILQNDPYIQLFLSQNCLRPSCGGNCRFRNEHRQGDITIADFKGLTKVFHDLSGTKRNYSAIIVNTEKGNMLLPVLEKTMILRECELRFIKEYNPLFFRQTWESKNRDVFFEEYVKDSVLAIKKWTNPAIVYRKSWKGKVFDILPTGVRRILIKRRGGANESSYSSCSLSKVRLQR